MHLVDDNEDQKETDYEIELQIVDEVINFKVQSGQDQQILEKLTTFEIQSISSLGIVVVEFSEPFLELENPRLVDESALSLIVISTDSPID